MSVDEDIQGAPELYQEYILDHYKNPRNHGKIEGAEIHHDGDNPVCGDMIEVWAQVDKNNHVTEIKFQGKGCAISQASASMYFEDVRGHTLDEIKSLGREKIFELFGMEITTTRVKCAILGQLVLKHGIQEFESKKGKPATPATKTSGGLKLNKLK